ncbi:hypothetical protein FJV80_16135 [Mesorhizobium sp. WSM4310]|uniref:hypothetical protein n=1 Tax=Mesorhizobium sp. WSM4310 TaxID=2589883 RepID=UPI00115CB7C4|nr:hypothetical protein [Mesorhizobium sp. WSM4310]TRC85833.1 hypothetical protein FJV80_16135 [Mesorhizobium sp. WSM4310]
MNIKRGLFRFWLALSLLWVLGVGALGYDQVANDMYFNQPEKSGFHFVPDVPVLCGVARGEVGTDYYTQEGKGPGPWDKYAKPNPFDTCWYGMTEYRKLWPENGALSDDALVQKLYKDMGRELNTADPLAATKRVGLFAFLPPVILLFLGLLLVWVASGFARPKEPPLAP